MTRRNGIVFTLMLIIGLGIFWWSFRRVKIYQVWYTLQHASWGWLLIALLAMVIYLLIEAVIVKLFVDRQDEKISWANAIRIPLVEQLGNGITPFSAGGQPMQLVALTQASVDAGRASSILLMKFVVYQAMIVVNFILALLIGYHYIATRLHSWSLFVLLGFLIHLAVIVGLLLVMYWPSFTKHLIKIMMAPVRWFSEGRHNQYMAILDEKVESFHIESIRISRDWSVLWRVIGLTFVQLAFYYLIPYFILLGLGATHVDLLLVMSLHILIVMVISLFPIPGGAGGAELGFSLLFTSFLSNSATLVLAMMIWRILTYYLGMFSGIVAFNIRMNSKQR